MSWRDMWAGLGWAGLLCGTPGPFLAPSCRPPLSASTLKCGSGWQLVMNGNDGWGGVQDRQRRLVCVT
jgi:hypothetical protein